MIFRPYYGFVIRRRILSHTHTHADTLLGESRNLMTAPKEAQKSNLMTEAVNLQHNIARGVSHLIAHLSVFRRSHHPAASPASLPPSLLRPLSVTCFPSHMFSLSSLSSHVILSPSFTGSTGWEYLGELRPGCKEHSRSGILPVLALPQPTPLKPEHTYSFPSAPVTPASTHPSGFELRATTFVTPSDSQSAKIIL